MEEKIRELVTAMKPLVTVVFVAANQNEPITTKAISATDAEKDLKELVGGEFVTFTVPNTGAIMLVNKFAVTHGMRGNPRVTLLAQMYGVVPGKSPFGRFQGDAVFVGEPIIGVYEDCPGYLALKLVSAQLALQDTEQLTA